MNSFLKQTNKKNTSVKISQQGFTLVEIMVSISIFTIIMVTGMGALVTVTRSYQTSRVQSAMMNSIHFAMDSMVRDIRIGKAYHAGDFSPLQTFGDQYNFNDSDADFVLNFMGIPERGHLRYTLNPDEAPYLSRYQFINGDEFEYPMIIDSGPIEIEKAIFRVSGSDPDDTIQPSVFIYLRGLNTQSGATLILQTFVSQRSLDI